MEDTKIIENFLDSCCASLKGGQEIYPDYKIAFYAMTKADKLAQAACAIFKAHLDDSKMGQLRIFILNALGMWYEDSVDMCIDSLIEPQPAVLDAYTAACGILCHCCYLMHRSKVDAKVILSHIMKNYSAANSFIRSAEGVYSDYNKLIKSTWGVLEEL